MKRKILSILFALVLACSLSLVTAVPVMANSVASSTMHFEGVLTPSGDGYSGTIPMTKGIYYAQGGPGELAYNGLWPGVDQGGFDLYAEEGGTAYVSCYSPTENLIGSDHDAYPEGGAWGDYYNPDCADYHHYALTLTSDSWQLVYHSSGGWTTDGGVPMSGTMVWNGDNTGYASETGTGYLFGSMAGTALNPGDAAVQGGGPGAWDIDWSWGSEVIPLQYVGFNVAIEDLGTGDYKVTMTPAEASSSVGLSADVKGILGIRVDPTSIDFGSLYPGQISPDTEIAVANIGTVNCNVSTSVSPTGTVFDNLLVGGQSVPYSNLIVGLTSGSEAQVNAQLVVPPDYPPGGTETATLIFEAATQ